MIRIMPLTNFNALFKCSVAYSVVVQWLNSSRKTCLFFCIFIYREGMISSMLIEKVTELSKNDTDFIVCELTSVQFHIQSSYVGY